MVHFDESASVPEGVRQMFARSNVSLTLADARHPDYPIVGVNEAFCTLSGYDPQEILGRNCRFLQPSGGAGPVRMRMRRFLADPQTADAKFLLPNMTRQGKRFLNLLYMAKLAQGGEVAFVLGSQFVADMRDPAGADYYDLALREDLRQFKLLTGEHNWTVLGSFDALASSHSIIARARME